MTELKFVDKRENTIPTFGDLNIGDSFTSVNGEIPFIKTAVMYDEHKDAYNTVALDGEFYWSDDDEEIVPLREIEITMKK
jgi:alpha-acetolactate decarboxylase